MNTPTLKSLRTEAKSLKQEQSLKTHQAQLEVAKKYGYPDWRTAVTKLESQLTISLPCAQKPNVDYKDLDLTAPTFSLADNNMCVLVGVSGSGKSLILKEASRQAIQQGFDVIYIGYFGNDPRDKVNFDFAGISNFHPFEIDFFFDESNEHLEIEDVLSVVRTASKPMIIIDETEHVNNEHIATLLDVGCITIVSGQTYNTIYQLGKYAIDERAISVLIFDNEQPVEPFFIDLYADVHQSLGNPAMVGVWTHLGNMALVPQGRDLVTALSKTE